MSIRIGVVSPMNAAMGTVADAFATHWPEAEVINLLDESLYADFGGGKEITEETYRRVGVLLQYSQDSGSQAMLFTGSVFGAVIEECRKSLSVPVLASYEAMIEEAFTHGDRFGILTTAPGALRCLSADLERYAEAHGKSFTMMDHIEDAARPIILAGDIETHDRMVAAAADKMTDCNALLLGQFSMGSAVKYMQDMPNRPVLSPPDTAALKLKRMFS